MLAKTGNWITSSDLRLRINQLRVSSCHFLYVSQLVNRVTNLSGAVHNLSSNLRV